MRTRLGKFLEWVRGCRQPRSRRSDEAEIATVLLVPSASSPRRLQGLRRLSAFGSALTVLVVAGCAGRAPVDSAATGASHDGEAPIIRCETAEQIRALRPCKATVEKHYPCYSIFKTGNGKRLTIGSPGASLEVIQFLRVLKQGQTYAFPDAFLDFQRTNKQRDV